MYGIDLMNSPDIDLRLLRCFAALMAERNVSRAAARVDLSQPAMSHALSRLRRLFGDPLLLMTQGRMTPTGRALELEKQVAEVLEGAARLTAPPSAFDPATSALRFSIMAPEYVEYLLAPRLAAQLATAAPRVDVEFRNSDPEHAWEWMERGELDFRLGWLPDPPETLRSKPLFRDRLVCIARRGHPQARNGWSVEAYFAAGHVRIQTPRTGESIQAIDAAAAKLRRKVRTALQVQNPFALGHVVEQSDLIASVTARMAGALAEKYPIQISALPFTVPDVRIALYWHERAHQQPGHRWFRQLLDDTARAL